MVIVATAAPAVAASGNAQPVSLSVKGLATGDSEDHALLGAVAGHPKVTISPSTLTQAKTSVAVFPAPTDKTLQPGTSGNMVFSFGNGGITANNPGVTIAFKVVGATAASYTASGTLNKNGTARLTSVDWIL